MGNKRVLRNTISSILVYGALLVFSILTSRFVLIGYGSETNGLLSSVNQIFSYIALLEAGIGTATVRALYGPLNTEDPNAVQAVLAASRAYYRKGAVWYFLCVIAVSSLWPFVLQTSIGYWTIWGLIFFHGVSGVITYCYTSTIMNYMMASGNNYLNDRVHSLSTLVTYGLKLLICVLGRSIVWISVAMIVVNVGKCILYRIYMKKLCPVYYQSAGKADTSLLKQRGAFLIHEISGVIFYGTDTIVISVFCGLTQASIYAVYALVLTALKNMIGQAFNATKYVLGSKYAKDPEHYAHTHDVYNSIYICAVFIVFTVAYLMLLPFIALYTDGVADANYLDPKLPVLFVLIELLSACRIVGGELIRLSLHAKQTIGRTIAEAVINLVMSIVLVQFIGIYGVLFGTIAALLYRSNDIILYANCKLMKRKAWREYGLYGVNFAIFGGAVLLSKWLHIEAQGYLQLLMWAVVVFVAVAAVYLAVNFAVNKNLRAAVMGKLRKQTVTHDEKTADRQQ